MLAGTIFLTTHLLRHRLRSQIVGRDAAVLNAVAAMYEQRYAETLAEVEALEEWSDDPAAHLDVLLEASEMAGVLGLRLFDPAGEFVAAFPAHVIEQPLPADHLTQLKRLEPVAQFEPDAELSSVFLPPDLAAGTLQGTQPLLIVEVPLHLPGQQRLLAVGQFLLEGQSVAAEFARLDRYLMGQAAVAFAAGGGLLGLFMAWAFRRLRRAQRLLAERNRQLLRANQELALSAKTSALGAVAAHLIHGLSSPLTGLQTFMHNHTREADEEWQAALASTRRMQELVNEIARLLSAENGLDSYEVSLEEVLEVVRTRVQPAAQAAGVKIRFEGHAKLQRDHRDANLLMLILDNLMQNAVEATRPGGEVLLRVIRGKDHTRIEVQDTGPGLPEQVKARLFTPCRSTKAGGHGLGLAISKQLANHLGWGLELVRSEPTGSVFAVRIPDPSPSAKAEVVEMPQSA